MFHVPCSMFSEKTNMGIMVRRSPSSPSSPFFHCSSSQLFSRSVGWSSDLFKLQGFCITAPALPSATDLRPCFFFPYHSRRPHLFHLFLLYFLYFPPFSSSSSSFCNYRQYIMRRRQFIVKVTLCRSSVKLLFALRNW